MEIAAKILSVPLMMVGLYYIFRIITAPSQPTRRRRL